MPSRHLAGANFLNMSQGSTPESTAWLMKVIRLIAEDYHIEKTRAFVILHEGKGPLPTCPTSFAHWHFCLPGFLQLLPCRPFLHLRQFSFCFFRETERIQSCRKLWNAMLPNIPVPLPFFPLSSSHPDFFFLDSAWISVNPSPTYPSNSPCHMPLYSFKVSS